MNLMRALLPALLGPVLLLAAARAHAEPVSAATPATGSVNILKPAEIRKLQDLNFATLAVTGAGTAVIDPNTDSMTTTGGVMHVRGTPYAAMFEAVSPRKGVVIIRLPRNPITLTRDGGTETMTVSNWTSSGSGKRTVASQEPVAFKVGGTLTVAANQAEGLYTGTFDVEIQFP